MRFAVVGAGGVGAFLGGRLARAGHDVSFVARGRTLEALRARGLRLTGDEDFTVPAAATDDPASIGPVDYVLSCVKATQITEALAAAGPLLGPGTAVVTTQNGVDGPRLTADVVGAGHTLPGVMKIFAMIERPGVIARRGGPGTLEVGEWDNAGTARVRALRAVLEGAGVGSPEPDDIWAVLWRKAMMVIPLGELGAITGLTLGELLARPRLADLWRRATAEIAAVARAHGIDVGEDAVEETMAFNARQPAGSTASLCRDLMAGRPSELDPQTGAIVRLAHEAGVPVPLHDLMYEVLRLGRAQAG
ncbi:2-dehydropantoate 2-reductase [Propionibacterium australiense]|uniref:2-dehydropantoate 2-reductase n=1 Tax=Propionibacterium australiense TaxID=119981 RepID=A0A383S616_9ACTN|nr:2-dehydropantoate 2-reductase [Propionibacterium australiense]RLP10667.1 2-dehydropantoate 2-reductase [Propionibacterium australiense]RLP12962.1 2-dehydropantoate 2-reductase [Propionibacterium australiense]SYZ32874.1 Ketopantoate reductase ApbA/PanE [Propionibacterium australiense]